jgi:MobA/MobL family
VAIFSYSVGERVRRGGTIKAAAYLSRACYEDQKTGWRHDFSNWEKRSPIHEASDHIARAGRHAEIGSWQEVRFLGLYGPDGAPDNLIGAENIGCAWNAAEAAEGRRDAQVAERVRIALPAEFTVEQARWAIQDHVREFTRQGRLVQVAIHSAESGAGHDERNLHCHLLVSLRGVDENGFKASKTAEQQDRYLHRSQYVERLRENWAHVVNRHLTRHGHEAGLDHRSYQRQGVDREPTLHMGPGDAAHERRGRRTDVGDHNRGVEARNADRARQSLDQAVEARHDPRLITDKKQLDALREAVDADRTRTSWGWRARTVEDIARELSPQFAAADDARKSLLKAAGKDKQDRLDREGDLAWASRNERARREELGGMRSKLHDWGVWRDDGLTSWESRAKAEVREIQKIIKRQKDRSPKIEKALRQYGKRFARVEPKAKEKLAELQGIGGEARERLSQHRAAERAQERHSEREHRGKHRGRGIGL